MSADGTKSADNLIMSVNLSVSIILCSCHRGARLQQALGALGKVRIRPRWQVELLVVDNGSADDTATVVRNAKLNNMEVRYLHEAQKGKGHALNAGLAKARGE